MTKSGVIANGATFVRALVIFGTRAAIRDMTTAASANAIMDGRLRKRIENARRFVIAALDDPG